VLSFLALFATWVILSGHYDAWFLASGAACSAFVVWLMLRLELFGRGPWPLDLVRLVVSYVPWLLWQVAKANVDVARRVWHPGTAYEPQIVRVPCRLKTEAGVALLANSITLTPGTVTVAIEESELVVHSLSDASTRSVLDGSMHDRVARLERTP
jgi:multicomponent Na+:H+ antiporter subunit E